MKKILLLVFTFLCIELGAVPALPGLREFQQPNGEKILLELKGDENYSYFKTKDGFEVIKGEDDFFYFAEPTPDGYFQASQHVVVNNPFAETEVIQFLQHVQKLKNKFGKARQSFSRSQQDIRVGSVSYPTKGEVKSLVILVEFADKRFYSHNNVISFGNQMNQIGYSENGATGSVRDYFLDQSMGQFDPTFDVVGPVRLKNNLGYYGDRTGNRNDRDAPQMVVDACLLVDDQVDFSRYDLDQDGRLDLVYIIFAGYAESQSGIDESIWPHAWDINFGGKSLTLDNTQIGRYACSSELAGSEGDEQDAIGTFCHEFSHVLGLPDLYDTSGYDYNYGMKNWDVMDVGSYNNSRKTPPAYSSYERWFLGWLELEELEVDGIKQLESIETSNKGYIIYNEQDENEYFIFENRQPNKWDVHLPSHGMLITHVQYDPYKWSRNMVNAYRDSPGLTLKPADNELLLYEGENWSEYRESMKADIYPGVTDNTTFTNTSIPQSCFYDGGYSNKPISSIRVENEVVYFDYMKQPIEAPADLRTYDIHAAGFSIEWDDIVGANQYTIRIKPDIANVSLVHEEFTLFKEGDVLNPDNTNIENRLDEYMTTSGWSGKNIFQAGEICHIGDDGREGYLLTPLLQNPYGEYELRVSFGIRSGTDNERAGMLLLETPGQPTYYYNLRTTPSFTSRTYGFPAKEKSRIRILASTPFAIDNLTISALNKEEVCKTHYVEGIVGNNYSLSDLLPNTPYVVQVKSYQGTSFSPWSNAITVRTTIDTSGEVVLEKSAIQYYTEPGILGVRGKEGELIQIYSVQGALVLSYTLINNEARLELSPGIYILHHRGEAVKVVVQ